MSAETYVPTALADLESRAGASDQDREKWLAERAQGITATEVRDLVLGKIRRDELISRKLGRSVDPFGGNAYTAWGSERESVIAAVLAGEGFVEEHRVFHHPENSRHLASPDGLRLDFDEQIEVLEIKTAKHDLPPGFDAIAEKGYELQVQWVMWVIGARRCRFVVEERLGTPRDGFEAGALHRHWIERDDAVIARLVTVADEFLAELDRQRDEGAPEIDERIDTLALNYLRGAHEEKQGAALKKEAYEALVEAGVTQKSAIASVTFTPGKPGVVEEVEELDLGAARAAHPEEWERLQEAQDAWRRVSEGFVTRVARERPGSKARVTVRAVKQKEEKAA